MKRYMVFCYDTYYPSGGMYDFSKDFDNYQEAVDYCITSFKQYDNVNIYDTKLSHLVYDLN
jgi:hypothetical protein